MRLAAASAGSAMFDTGHSVRMPLDILLEWSQFGREYKREIGCGWFNRAQATNAT